MTPLSPTIVETSAGPIVARDPELAAAIEAMLATAGSRHTEDDLSEVVSFDLDA